MILTRCFAIAALWSATAFAWAVSGPDEETVERPPGPAVLTVTSAVPEATEFPADGSTHLVWEDSGGRRSRAVIAIDGSLRLYLPGEGVREFPPRPRILTAQEEARANLILDHYYEHGVDLQNRRARRPADPPRRTVMRGGGGLGPLVVWMIFDACLTAEKGRQNACLEECASIGMSAHYRSGVCGAGSTCACVYVVERQPDPT
ncbi:hypothetical protein [Arenimonas sp.]|uniref:hypothetical protein n=1 Tax=Arenimonas sp. TaxID=1872635 RepID=UPI0035B1F275